MARNSEQDGVATDLARQAADKARQAAGWHADRDPGSLLDEVRSFARRKPGTYLAIALAAGVLAGRLTRGLTAPDDQPSTAAPTSPATPTDRLAAHPQTRSEGELRSAARGYDPVPVITPAPLIDPIFPGSPPVTAPGVTGPVGIPRDGLAP